MEEDYIDMKMKEFPKAFFDEHARMPSRNARRLEKKRLTKLVKKSRRDTK